MAGRFTSVLDVEGWDAFLNAAHRVIDSATAVLDDTGVARPIAVLVQRQLCVAIGGVLFGVDPVTGDRDHVVVEAVAGRPDVLSAARHLPTTTCSHAAVGSCRGPGRVRCPALDGTLRRSLARMARTLRTCLRCTAGHRMVRRHDRPTLDVAEPTGHRDGERRQQVSPSCSDPGRSPRRSRPGCDGLEEDLWIRPLRDGVTWALRTAGAASEKALARSPIVTTVNGWAVVDLELFGLADGRTTLRRRINPSVIIRRARYRLARRASSCGTPGGGRAIVSSVDRDLAAIPRLDEVATGGLVDLIERARRELATVHSHEVLAGMLLGADQTGPSAAALAAWALHDARRAAGWDDDEIVIRAPVVLTLSPPSLDAAPSVPTEMVHPGGEAPSIDDLGSREALRLRARWLQELEARLARELGRRLVDEGALSDELLLGELGLSELVRGRRRWPATE